MLYLLDLFDTEHKLAPKEIFKEGIFYETFLFKN